jgi:hypothetical protein
MKCLGRIALLLLVSGCVEVETYPDAWPARVLVPAGSCPDISGDYGFNDSGSPRDFRSERALRVLHELAGFQGISPVPDRVWILQRRDETLRIEAFVENTSARMRDFTSENATIRCHADGLFIKPPPLEQIIDGGGQTIRRDLRFSTAEDGSLVFREKYTATSRILVIPVAGFGIRWNRLDRVGS